MCDKCEYNLVCSYAFSQWCDCVNVFYECDNEIDVAKEFKQQPYD